MGARNCEELGISLQKIVSRLMENNELINLLYYEDIDPFSQLPLTKEEKQERIYNKLVRIIPNVGALENSKSLIAVYINKGTKNINNPEFKQIQLFVDVFTPYNQWIIKDSNLRPFAILGQIQKSLDNKIINGLGKLIGGDFELTLLTNEVSCYRQIFNLIEYD
jgi:hypothetical protein